MSNQDKTAGIYSDRDLIIWLHSLTEGNNATPENISHAGYSMINLGGVFEAIDKLYAKAHYIKTNKCNSMHFYKEHN